MSYPRIASLKTGDQFAARLAELNLKLAFDDVLDTGPDSPLARPYDSKSCRIGNRFSILPMEGWDGTNDGRPSDLTRRRWRNFGLSGAKLIWGGEAIAVRPDGRDNTHQLLISDATLSDLEGLKQLLLDTHQSHFGKTDDLLIGLQLTHSGRFAKSDDRHFAPRIMYRHPILDLRFGVHDDRPLLSDDELAQLTDDFIQAGKLAQKAGYTFVDIKHCHGYLGHEMLSSFDRPGRYGGSIENRTRFFPRDVTAGLRAEAPGLDIGVRISIYDFLPFQPGPENVGVPSAPPGKYGYAFGGDGTGLGIDLNEPTRFLELLLSLGIELVCMAAGSPYYNPHIQRPAIFPPSDGYSPPEDPLVGVARQIEATAQLKHRFPDLLFVGAGYSYLQEWLPHVGQRQIRDGNVDFIGLGRMVLSYPDLPADVLAGRPLARKRICRTFSDCTTAPRKGLISGCYPLDPFYKELPEAEQLLQLKHPK